MKRLLPSAARVFVAAYMGALLFGPPPLGFSPTVDFGSTIPAVLGIAGLFLLPWIVIGVLVGRFAVVASLLTLLALQVPFVVGEPIGYLAFLAVPAAMAVFVAWLSGHITRRRRIGKTLDGWRGWRVAAIAIVLLATYCYVLAPGAAIRNVRARFGDLPNLPWKAHWCGLYIAVDRKYGEDTPRDPYTYYTDPTGSFFIYKSFL